MNAELKSLDSPRQSATHLPLGPKRCAPPIAAALGAPALQSA